MIPYIEYQPKHSSKEYKLRKSSPGMIVIHCSDRDWTVQQLAEYDVGGSLTYERKCDGKTITDTNHINSKGLPGITYQVCLEAIPDDTVVYQTLPDNRISYHAAGYNSKAIAIGLLYRTTNPANNKPEFRPPPEMVEAAQEVTVDKCFKFGLTPDDVRGHRELEGTGWEWIDKLRGRKRLLKSCPGPFVDMDQFRYQVAVSMQMHLQLEGLYTGVVDGLFYEKSKLALKQYCAKYNQL